MGKCESCYDCSLFSELKEPRIQKDKEENTLFMGIVLRKQFKIYIIPAMRYIFLKGYANIAEQKWGEMNG